MPQSSSSELRLRGVFQKPTPQMQKQIIYLKNKLPLNQTVMKKLDVPVGDNLNFYYKSVEQVLEDYKAYIVQFLKQTEKTAAQYILDINEVWSTVDSNMILHPNQLQDTEDIKTTFFLLMRQKLEDNKGKEEAEQTDHVLAKTIKLKLQSAIRFTDFL